MTIADPTQIVIGSMMLLFALGIYVRRLLTLRRTQQRNEPLPVDGWNTFSSEPEYQEVLQAEHREAFGRFCGLALAGVVLVAHGYGINVKPDVFTFLMGLPG